VTKNNLGLFHRSDALNGTKTLTFRFTFSALVHFSAIKVNLKVQNVVKENYPASSKGGKYYY